MRAPRRLTQGLSLDRWAGRASPEAPRLWVVREVSKRFPMGGKGRRGGAETLGCQGSNQKDIAGDAGREGPPQRRRDSGSHHTDIAGDAWGGRVATAAPRQWGR